MERNLEKLYKSTEELGERKIAEMEGYDLGEVSIHSVAAFLTNLKDSMEDLNQYLEEKISGKIKGDMENSIRRFKLLQDLENSPKTEELMNKIT